MKYTVLLKCLFSDGLESKWMQVIKEADDEPDADTSVRKLVERENECTVIATKIFPYSEGDENGGILNKVRQQEEKENAPINLIRTLKHTNYTLDDIATELRGIRASRPEEKHVISALLIVSTTLSLLTATLLLLSLILW